MASNVIPTLYRGVLHRSRLEARWSVFFEHLGVKAEYETEGFNTDGERYLPDFYVFAALGTIWVEIKPGWKSDPGGVAKFRRFAVQRPQPTRAALIAGLPAIGNKILVIGGDIDAADPLKGPWEDDGQEWRPCTSGQHFDLCFPGQFRAKFVQDGCPDSFGGNGEDKLLAAITAACSGRFGKDTAGPQVPDPGTGSVA